jgi:outer membrane protein OmpA-like peptidoglycan-associated protein
LIGQLEAKKSDMGMDTLLLPTSKMIRPDLWRQAAELKKRPGFSCGEDLVARLEVQLVWAGHEDNQLGWRHAKPYLQAAERLAGDARRKIDACPIGQTVAADTSLPSAAGLTAEKADETALPVSPASTPPVSSDSASGTKGRTPGAFAVGEEIPDRVHFAVNSDIISARSAAVLERLATVLRANPGVRVELQGHADDRGNEERNRILSRNRAEVVRTYLVAAGVDRSRLPVQAFGDSKPVRHGNDIVSFAHNRRVEFVFTGGDGQIKPFAQYEDLRIEENRTHDR